LAELRVVRTNVARHVACLGGKRNAYGVFVGMHEGMGRLGMRGLSWLDNIWYDNDDMFVNCSWVDTSWQQYSTHLHTNSTQNNTVKQNTQNGTYINNKNI